MVVAGCTSHITGLSSLLQHSRHRGVSLRCTSTRVRAASSIPEEPKSVQRKVSHILVKRDQENLLDEIEDRLAGVYDQSERILTRLPTVSTAYLQWPHCLRFPQVKVEALKSAQTTSYFASMLLVFHCLCKKQCCHSLVYRCVCYQGQLCGNLQTALAKAQRMPCQPADHAVLTSASVHCRWRGVQDASRRDV